MKRLALLAAALLAGGCGSSPEAYLFVLDDDYRAEMVGRSEDGFAAPDGLRWHDGGLIMADEGGSAVRYWRPGAAPQTLADARSRLESPEDVVRDEAGTIYFTDDDAGGVRRIDPQGRIAWLARPDQGLTSTEGLALAPSGMILAGDQQGRRVMAVAPDGGVTVLIGPEAGIAKPESMAFDDSGNLYIADNKDNILYLVTRDGRLHRPIAGREGFSPESIVWANGALYITDSANSALYRYTLEDGLRPIAIFAGDLANVQGVAADPQGNLYVSVQADLEAGRGYVLRLARRR